MKNNQKHILVLNRSFWPDIEATGQFLTELCEHLVKEYKITVIAGRSYYVKEKTFKYRGFYARERFNDIEIFRVRHTKFWKGSFAGRIINWFTYSLLAFIAALNIKPHVIIACTDPPLLGIIAVLLSRLRAVPFIYNCGDLYPDVAVELKTLKQGFISRTFDRFDIKALQAASVVVCPGQSMANRVKAKGVREEQIKVISYWIDTNQIRPVSKENNPLLKKFGLENKFVVMYSGNIGLSQDFSSILQAISIIKERSSWCMVFIGEGVNKKNLEDEVQALRLENVLFFPYQTRDTLAFSLGMADLHIVPLKKALTGAIVPSKVFGIMASGRPYLAITGRESEPACMAEEFECGIWAPPGDAEAIAERISWALTHKEKLDQMGRKARWIAETKFDKNIVLNEWLKILNCLV